MSLNLMYRGRSEIGRCQESRRESYFLVAMTLTLLFSLSSGLLLRQPSRDIMLIIKYAGKKLDHPGKRGDNQDIQL